MPRVTRRVFLRTLGKGATAVAILGIAACSDDAGSPTTTSTPAAPTSSTTTLAQATTTPTTLPASTTTAPPSPTSTAPAEPGGATVWERVNLGFVSAYVVARGGRAAVVDTGVSGSAGQIESGLGALGVGWGAVDHVILTHFHGDHVGSVGDVLERAAGAAAYAGEADIPEIRSPRPLVAVADGDEVFGLQIIETPGHTPGHVAVLDPGASVLVAGDALNGGDAAGTVAGPNPQFTPDMATAHDSVRKLAALSYDTLFFGHGEPVLGGAAAQVAALAATL